VKREFGENHDYYMMKDLGLEKNSPQWKKTWRQIEQFYRNLDGDDLEQFLMVNLILQYKFYEHIFCCDC